MRRNVILIAFLSALLFAGLISGCKEGEGYVDDNVEQLAKAEKLQDQNLAKLLTNACEQLVIEKMESGTDKITWQDIKTELDGKSISYLESLEKDNYSDGSLSASVHDKGWIKVRQGWIIISTSQQGSYYFQFSEEKP